MEGGREKGRGEGEGGGREGKEETRKLFILHVILHLKTICNKRTEEGEKRILLSSEIERSQFNYKQKEITKRLILSWVQYSKVWWPFTPSDVATSKRNYWQWGTDCPLMRQSLWCGHNNHHQTTLQLLPLPD